ncbi:hypothetical protein [Klebsiella aerogenes]|uniref:hypothetical protein n=1 Tax=Klebsiella aerogenes TaxID=548 RepID=UPI000DA206F9|nr:hypothetical protein [Klebsiella aerogenes]HCB2859858.1 hypothetical protein [Klebsiella aerogenes]HCB2864861.1 hypothetical protein [Klebsiella aerogenes]HCB2880467.1 hypothetical protein [Klebsiella aerogenes]HCB3345924.1 hypothetical protein [Klebsiella aerogenes]HCM1811926.1 hypothetical protein [Klebsiella aerogenes]
MANGNNGHKHKVHITWIVDVREGEPDILSPVKMECLVIRECSGEELHRQEAPAEGWTLEKLFEVEPEGEPGVVADAWIGQQWAGSTEI